MNKFALSHFVVFIIWISSSQAQEFEFSWLKTAGAAGTHEDIGRAIAIDADKNIIIGGRFSGSATFDGININSGDHRDFFIAKYDSLGNILWVNEGGSDEPGVHGYDLVDDLALDAAGNIYISGYVGKDASYKAFNFPSESGAFICKLDPNGDLIWANSFFTTYDSNYDRAKGEIECDQNGNVYFSTNFIDDINLHDTLLVMEPFPGKDHSNNIITMKFDPDGNREWFSTGWGYAANLLEEIKIDNQGNVIIYGHNKWSIDFGEGFLLGQNWLVKYSPTGDLIWAINPPSQHIEVAKGMDVDEEDYIYVLNRADASKVDLKKVNPSGELLWAKVIAESDFLTPNHMIYENDICYITGWYEGSLQTELSNVEAKGVKDIFILSADGLDGEVTQVMRAGSAADFPLGYFDSGYGLFKDEGDLYVTGSYKGLADFGDLQLQAEGEASDIFFGKLELEPGTDVDDYFSEDLELHPVPASDRLYISGTQSSSSVKRLFLSTAEGKVLDKWLDYNEGYIDVSELQSGIYFLHLESNDGKVRSGKVVVMR